MDRSFLRFSLGTVAALCASACALSAQSDAVFFVRGGLYAQTSETLPTEQSLWLGGFLALNSPSAPGSSWQSASVTGPNGQIIVLEQSAQMAEMFAIAFYNRTKAELDALMPVPGLYTFNFSHLDGGSSSVPFAVGEPDYPAVNGLGLVAGDWTRLQAVTPYSVVNFSITATLPEIALELSLTVMDSNGDTVYSSSFDPQQRAFYISDEVLRPNETYSVTLNFLTRDVEVDSENGFMKAGAYSTGLAFNLTTVPEPSVYALGLGALALSVVCWRRKRGSRA